MGERVRAEVFAQRRGRRVHVDPDEPGEEFDAEVKPEAMVGPLKV